MSTLAYLYFLRVPALVWVLVFLFGPFALNHSMLHNLLVTDASGVFWITTVGAFACAASWGAMRNIIDYGKYRFDMPAPAPDWMHGAVIGALAGGAPGAYSLLALPVCALILLRRTSIMLLLGIVSLAAFLLILKPGWIGTLVGAAVLSCAFYMARRWRVNSRRELDPDFGTSGERRLLEFGIEIYAVISPAVVTGFCASSASELGLGWEVVPITLPIPLIVLFFFLPRYLGNFLTLRRYQQRHDHGTGRFQRLMLSCKNRFGPGFVAESRAFVRWGRITTFRPGHIYLIGLDIVAAVLFLVLTLGRMNALTGGRLPGVFGQIMPPALAFVLLALSILCLVISFFAFVLDRYRVPLLIPMLLLAWLTGGSSTDHVFQSFPADQRELHTLAQSSSSDRMIVIVAPGGGIQASGWTATVLCGLAEAIEEFPSSVRAISSVSGGSVGTMFAVGAWEQLQQPGSDRKKILEQARKNSVAPLLETVAWGLVALDLPGLLRPWGPPRELDRGWALERELGRSSGLGNRRLSSWSEGVSRGLPVLLFNAMEVETGQAVIFSTARFNPRKGIKAFTATRDLPIVTAVRLSATFPFVSPVARPKDNQLLGHAGDGGYYDNEGIVSLLDWLDQEKSIKKILLLRINPFPQSGAGAKKELSVGWPFQFYAPLKAVQEMRSAAQKYRNDRELEFNKSLEKVDIPYEASGDGCQQPPLSWNLNKAEIKCLDDGWARQEGRVSAAVRLFLKK